MPELPPRLDVNPPTQTGYAPISWTAVTSLGVGAVFAVLLLVMAGVSFWNRQPLIQPLLFFTLAALAVVLAFVARRQIASSEGTRTGVGYANAGWWIAVVGGLGYAAYLVALEFDVRRQAEQVFVKWTDNLKDLDPANPRDPKVYAAAYLTIDPGVRAAVRSPENVTDMERTFRDPVAAFRQSDLVQLAARNPGRIEFRPQGLQDWRQKPGEVDCALAATATSPEGEHRLLVPMRAMVDLKTKQRQWQVTLTKQGYVTGRSLTPYGWTVLFLEQTGRTFTQEFLARLGSPGQSQYAYLAFVRPGSDPKKGADLIGRITATAPGRAAVGGAAALVPSAQPGLAGADEYLAQHVFGRPNGEPATPSDLRYVGVLWETPGKIAQAGSVLKANPDTNPSLTLVADRIEFRVPVELVVVADGPNQAAARGRVVLRMEREAEATWLAKLADLREKGGGAARSDEVPADLRELPAPPWRVVRIESDFVPQFNPKTGPGAGGPGGM